MEAKIRASFTEAILQEALRRYGIQPDQIHLLDGFENFIYAFQHGDQQRILRISHSLHRTAPAIQGEMEWLDYLAGQGVAVAGPVPSLSGQLVEVLIPAEPEPGAEYFSACAFQRAPGGPPQRSDWEAGLMVQLGSLLGRMNRLAKDYRPRDPQARPHLLDDCQGNERFLPPGEIGVAEKYRRLMAELAELPTDSDSYGLVHQDAHGGNFFVHNGQITLFDFDDCMYAWYAYDLAMAFFYILPHDCSTPENLDFARMAFGQLLAGYRRENQLDPRWLAEIPRFLKQREIDLYIIIHRSLNLDDLDPWTASFMAGRREKILNDVPYVDLDFMALGG